ncbi:hypothetical protein ACFQ9X_12705 [Catenulispora yoronensis]
MIVKVNWVVTTVQLTAAQQAVLDHHPSLATKPEQIIAALGLPQMNEPTISLGRVGDGLDSASHAAE